MSGARGGFGDIAVQEVCIEGDGICNMPKPRDAPEVFVDSVFGYFTKHNTYTPMMSEPAPPAPPRRCRRHRRCHCNRLTSPLRS